MSVEDMMAAGEEAEGCTSEVEGTLELMPVESSVLLIISDDVLDTAVDVTGVGDRDEVADVVTTKTPG
jgi:hypothetical protein